MATEKRDGERGPKNPKRTGLYESLARFEAREAKIADQGYRLFVEQLAGTIRVTTEGESDGMEYPVPNLALLVLWTQRNADFIHDIYGAARLRYALAIQKQPEKMEPLFMGDWPKREVLRAATTLEGVDAFTYLMGFRAVVDTINETAKKKEAARMEAALGDLLESLQPSGLGSPTTTPCTGLTSSSSESSPQSSPNSPATPGAHS